MKKNIVTLAFFITINLLNAQNVLSWKIYSDMKNVVAAAELNEYYFAATSGGIFLYDNSRESFITLTKVEGLSSHNLTSMTIDENNKVWITTQEGIINIYDFTGEGEIRKILDIYNSDKNQKRINHITSGNGKIYLSSSFGISILDSENESFDETIVRFGSFNAESKVNKTYVLDKIYIALDAGVAVQKTGAQNLSAPNSWDSYPISDFSPSSAINTVIIYNNQLLAGGTNGLYLFNNGSWSPLSFSNENIIDLDIKDDLLFITSDHSVHTYDGSSFERIFINNEMTIKDFQFASGNKILLSSDKGLWIIGGENPEVIIPDGPMTNSFMSVTIDHEGNLWAGSGKDVTGAGVFRFDGTNWDNFNTSNTPAFKTNAFHKVIACTDSAVYLMNWGSGFTSYKNGIFKTYDHTNSPLLGITEATSFVVVSGVQLDTRGNLWILSLRPADRTQLSVLTTEGEWHQYSIDNPFIPASYELEHFAIDNFNTKWFAAKAGSNGGVYYFNENLTFLNKGDDVSGRYSEDSGLRNNSITSLEVDKRGELWIGNTIGINYFQIAGRQSHGINNPSVGIPLRGLTVNAIASDPINRKWVGTNQGLFLMSSDGTQAIELFQSTNSPLLSDDIKSIAINDKTGQVYVGTDFGLMVLETTTKTPVQSFEELTVFPNPFIVGNSYSTPVTIDGLIKNSSIKILTVDGELITEFITSGGRQSTWDGRDQQGNFVSSGIYIIVAYDEEVNNVTTGKVAVFNK